MGVVILRSLGVAPLETETLLGEETGSGGNRMRSVVNKFSLKCLWVIQVEMTSQLSESSLEILGAIGGERL